MIDVEINELNEPYKCQFKHLFYTEHMINMRVNISLFTLINEQMMY